MGLVQIKRITQLGRLGEDLVAERLPEQGFTDIENLNLRRSNYPFGDLLATKGGVRYFIGVKARNEMRQGDVGLNESYNLVLISDVANARLKKQGKTTDQITSTLLAEVSALAAGLDATPAWATVSIRPRAGTYSAYFGLVAQLGNRRSVPMTPKACSTYRCLARDHSDARVSFDFVKCLVRWRFRHIKTGYAPHLSLRKRRVVFHLTAVIEIQGRLLSMAYAWWRLAEFTRGLLEGAAR